MSDKLYEVDMSNQLDNPWNDDSVLSIIGVVNDDTKSSLRISSKYKLKIKQEFCHDIPTGKKNYKKEDYDKERNANRVVLSIMHAYMIYKLILLNPQIRGEVKACPENNKREKVEKYFTIACNNFNSNLRDRVLLKFRESKRIEGQLIRAPRSKAHRTALNTLRDRKSRCHRISESDFEELKSFIKSLYHKQILKK